MRLLVSRYSSERFHSLHTRSHRSPSVTFWEHLFIENLTSYVTGATSSVSSLQRIISYRHKHKKESTTQHIARDIIEDVNICD